MRRQNELQSLATAGPRPIVGRPVVAADAYRLWLSVAGVEYRYELRRGDQVIATGHLLRERPLEVGERLQIAGQVGIVRTIEPLLGEQELRLVVQLVRTHLDEAPAIEPRRACRNQSAAAT